MVSLKPLSSLCVETLEWNLVWLKQFQETYLGFLHSISVWCDMILNEDLVYCDQRVKKWKSDDLLKNFLPNLVIMKWNVLFQQRRLLKVCTRPWNQFKRTRNIEWPTKLFQFFTQKILSISFLLLSNGTR